MIQTNTKRVKVDVLDADKHSGIACHCIVNSLPTVIFFKNDKPRNRIVGVADLVNKRGYMNVLDDLLEEDNDN